MKNQPILILVVSLLITFSLKLYAEEVTKIEIIVYTNDGVESTIIDTNSDSLTLSTISQKSKNVSQLLISKYAELEDLINQIRILNKQNGNNESQLLISKYAELEDLKNQIRILNNENKELVPIMNSALTDSLNTKKQSKYYLSTGIGKIKGDVVANFLAGYKLFPNLSIEGGLITSAEVYSLATDSTSESGTTDGKAWTLDANAGLKATTNTSYLLGVNYSIPVFSDRPNNVPFPKLMPNLQINNNLDFYSKAGILFWGVDYSLFLDGTIVFDGVSYTPNGSIPFAKGKGSDIYYGIGLSYPLTNEAAIRTEYTKSKIAGVKIGGFSSSIVFEF
tara:strand:- start:175 stop:1179 length:1005 start_codon:yes stop_codon:yes gene_type:complete